MKKHAVAVASDSTCLQFKTNKQTNSTQPRDLPRALYTQALWASCTKRVVPHEILLEGYIHVYMIPIAIQGLWRSGEGREIVIALFFVGHPVLD